MFGPSVDEVWNKNKEKEDPLKVVRGPRKKPSYGKTAGMLLPPEVDEPLAEANRHYLSGNYPEAVRVLSEVVKVGRRTRRVVMRCKQHIHTVTPPLPPPTS